MKKLLKLLLALIIILSSLTGCLLALCVIDPTLADDMASYLAQAGIIDTLPGDRGDSADSGGSGQGDVSYRDAGTEGAGLSGGISPYSGGPGGTEESSGDRDGQGSAAIQSSAAGLAGPGQDGSGSGRSPYPTEVSKGFDAAKGIDDAIAGNAPDPSYVTPATRDTEVPDGLEGRSDYKTIEVKEAVVGDDSATALAQNLNVGQTGDGLSFDPLFYPYYNMLNDTGKHIYRQIYANALARNEVFAPAEPIGKSGLRTVIEAVFNDQPQLFWLDTSYSCKYKNTGECVEIDLAFNRTARDFERENSAFMSAAREIESGAAAYASDLDKEKFVHDALIGLVDYVRSAEMSQSAYSALVNRRSVCAGYARAYQLIMQELGIPCYYCVGVAGEDHAWNIVKLDDGFYNVDLTWDDTEGGNYDYFNKTDADYAPTHVRTDLSVRLPACDATGHRQENEDPRERARRSITEAGFDQGDIIYDLNTYYNNCSYQIRNLGKGSYDFSNVVGGEELYKTLEEAYGGEEYREAYLKSAMRAVGATSCHMSLEIERLKGDVYLVKHSVVLN